MGGKYDGVHYGKHYVNQVIFRVDFSSPLETTTVFSSNIVSATTANFSRPGIEKLLKYGGVHIDINSGATKAIGSSEEGREKTFTDGSTKNKAILSNLYLVIEYNRYSNYEDFFDAASKILGELWKIKDFSSSRIGMRYINIYNNDGGSTKILKSMFAKGISNNFSSSPIKTTIPITPIRSMTLTEYKYGDMRINHRTGLYNRVYPSSIISDDYVIDIDCFVEGCIDKLDEAISFMGNAHEAIQDLFENSICEKLRQVMRDGK